MGREVAMRFFVSLFAVGLMLAIAAPAGALTWDLNNTSNTSDYYLGGNAGWNLSGWGSVAPQLNDEAAVLARVNTQAANLKLGDITGGGYAINSFYTDFPGTPSLVYGSLYLSPTGGPGADVLVLLSPMTVSGSDPFTYTFDLSTPANYRTWIGPVVLPLNYDWSALDNWSAYDSAKSGTFGQVAALIGSSLYGGDYAAFFGPQIGMSGTHNTQFNVTEIQLDVVPEPLTMAGLMLGIGGLVTYVRKRRKA
jgi:hypothetical protein